MKKILILDDDKCRHDLFKEHFIGNTLYHALTVEEAQTYLSNDFFDYVLLDHDLGGQTYVLSGKGTGYELVEWMIENNLARHSVIVVHSFNPAGADNMVKALKNADYNVIRDPFPCKNLPLKGLLSK